MQELPLITTVYVQTKIKRKFDNVFVYGVYKNYEQALEDIKTLVEKYLSEGGKLDEYYKSVYEEAVLMQQYSISSMHLDIQFEDPKETIRLAWSTNMVI